MDCKSRRCPANGFTLIEAVVALLIVALGMTALYMQLNQVSSNAIYLRDKTLASWIGSNVVTEYSLNPEWPETGETEEDIEFANRDWHVLIEIGETDVNTLRRIDVRVSLADRPERVIHTVSGLLEPPVPAGFAPVRWEFAGNGGRIGGRGGAAGGSGDDFEVIGR